MAKVELLLPGGDGSALDVQKDGSSVVNPASILNFSGAVGVTDNGSEEAGIEIVRYWTESDSINPFGSVWTAKGSGTNRASIIYPKGAGGVGLGRSVQPTGAKSVAIGDQANASQFNAINITSEGLSSGQQSLAIGRRARATNTGSVSVGFEGQSEAVRGKAGGFGDLQKNTGFESFANSRGDSVGNSVINAWTGKNQIQRGIIGWDSRLTGAGNPDQELSSAQFVDLNRTFSGTAVNTGVSHFTPSGDDRLCHFISYVTIYIFSVTGSLGTIAAGNKKVVKIERCGIKSGGTLTLLGTLSSTVMFEDAALSGFTATYEVVSNNLSTRVTLPSLLGGGSVNVKMSAKCDYYETYILNS